MATNNPLQQIIEYAELGYDFSITTLYGKEAVRMVKRYSHKAEKKLICEQIFTHAELHDEERFTMILTFLYDNIQQQEQSGEYYISSTYNIEDN